MTQASLIFLVSSSGYGALSFCLLQKSTLSVPHLPASQISSSLMPYLAPCTFLCNLCLLHFSSFSLPFSFCLCISPPFSAPARFFFPVMSPSIHRFKAKASEPTSQRKLSSVEQPLLQELLPKAALHLVSALSDDEKQVLVSLVLFGRNALLTPKASISTGKSPWRPWKSSSSKAGMRQQVCRPCPFSDALDASSPLAEEASSKRSSLPHAKYKGGFSCDCFSCYSRVWSRWNASFNRDAINDILDVIENPPQGIAQGSKGKKKKKLDKKRGISEKKLEKDENLHAEMALSSRAMSEGPLGSMDTSCDALADDGPYVSITVENGPSISAEKFTAGHKKHLLRGLKQKEKPSVTSPNAALTLGNEENAISEVISTFGGSESTMGAVAIEIPENLTPGYSPCGALGLSSAGSQGKINTKLQQLQQQHHRLGKRRCSQVLPLDCEDILVEEGEQEAVIALENTHAPMSPRAADVGLGGRGFLARVFPDALGRVASRLWDLVSVRLRSRTVEYH